MTLNCNVIVIFPIYGQFGANLGLHGLQTEKRTKKSLTQLSYYCFEWRYYFWRKCSFLQKNTDSKIKGLLVLKYIFSETTYVCVIT